MEVVCVVWGVVHANWLKGGVAMGVSYRKKAHNLQTLCVCESACLYEVAAIANLPLFV